MKKELTALRERLVNKSQELKVGGTNFPWQLGLSVKKISFLCGTEHDKPPCGFSHGHLNHLEQRRLLSPLEHNLPVSLCLFILALPHPVLRSAFFPCYLQQRILSS